MNGVPRVVTWQRQRRLTTMTHVPTIDSRHLSITVVCRRLTVRPIYDPSGHSAVSAENRLNNGLKHLFSVTWLWNFNALCHSCRYVIISGLGDIENCGCRSLLYSLAKAIFQL